MDKKIMEFLEIPEPFSEIILKKNEKVLIERFQGQTLKQTFINSKFQLSNFFNIAIELVN